MSSQAPTSGYIAVVCFLLFTGVGACAQVHKLIKRTNDWRRGKLTQEAVCEGLHPVRELWSFSAFLLFALSGLTRSYVDYFLVLSRLPVVILSTIILWFLQFHGGAKAKGIFIFAVTGSTTLTGLLGCSLSGYQFTHSFLTLLVDSSLSVVSLLLFYGKQLQAFTMYQKRRSAAVSWLREGGLIIKDMTGLWYSLSMGAELRWVSVTHVLSFMSTLTICLVKFFLETRGGTVLNYKNSEAE